MAGFYVNHLKSKRAREFAAEIERHFLHPKSDEELCAAISFKKQYANDLQDVLSAAYAVHRDTPELFYYGMSFTAQEISGQITLITTPLYTYAEIQHLKSEIKFTIKKILSQIDLSASPWEQERQIFQYLQTHIKYEEDGAQERYNLIGPLIEQKSVCEGISKTFAVLCHCVGIRCIVVFDEKHMWNMVNINGRLSHVDATYGTDIGGICDYSYFNVPDSEINHNHGKEIACVPICTSSLDDYYHQKGAFFENEDALRQYLKRELLSGHTEIHAKLKSGNIKRVIEQVSPYFTTNFQCFHNDLVNTALIIK